MEVPLEALLLQTLVRVEPMDSSFRVTSAPLDLKLSVAPNASLQGAIEGHVIPTVSSTQCQSALS